MRKLNGIIKSFQKVVSKLEKLVETNHLLAVALNAEVSEKQGQIKELDYEADKANAIAVKISNLVS